MASFVPAYLFWHGSKFACPECSNENFRVESEAEPIRFWCDCGVYYTEESANTLMKAEEDPKKAESGQ